MADWFTYCEREHALRLRAVKAMQPSTCKRAPQQSILSRIVRAFTL